MRVGCIATIVAVAFAWAVAAHQAPGLSGTDRALYKQMLKDIREDVEKNYYDRTFGGIELAAHFEAAGERVAAATTTAEAIDAITKALTDFDDSHTRFYPPPRATRADYGWTMAAVGDAPLVMSVNSGSDAEKRGLRPGDRVVALNRFQPSRDNIWQIQHYYSVVRPQAQQRVVVRKPDGREASLDVASKVETRRVIQIGDAIEDAIAEFLAESDEQHKVGDILVWRMRGFRGGDDLSPVIAKARSAKGFVIDLRGNPGGLVDVLKELVGWTFDREVRAVTMVTRKGRREETTKPKSKPYLGPMAVLVDSRSASAAEIFARIVQIEKRGTVVGDRTAGMVMTSRVFPHSFGVGNVTFYGTSVTVGDVLMSDGGRLERAGVKPDELLLPTPADLAAGRDPALARAVTIAGGQLTADDAGRLYRK